MGSSPSTEQRRHDVSVPAPLFQGDGVKPPDNQTSMEELARLLSSVLGQGAASSQLENGARPPWNPRKVLICVAEQHRERLARQLSESGNQVFVAQDTRQAIERMRANPLDIVLLDQEFDSFEQGAAFVTREVSVLRPAQRRRLFFVLLSPVLRTMETHAAFLHNVNAIVNIKDIEDVPKVLEHTLRDYNDLYKDFNTSRNVHAL